MILESYEYFAERPFSFVTGRVIVSEINDKLDNINRGIIQKVWKISKDDGFFKKRGNGWRFTPKAYWRAEELGEETYIDEDIQNEILEVLLQNYRDDPVHPWVSRENLIGSLKYSEKEIDHNLWLLSEKKYVETQSYIDSKSSGYSKVKITSLGRDVV